MAILIDIKKKKSNVVYLADYLKKKISQNPIDVRKLDREITKYKKEANEAAKELRGMLQQAGDDYGKD